MTGLVTLASVIIIEDTLTQTAQDTLILLKTCLTATVSSYGGLQVHGHTLEMFCVGRTLRGVESAAIVCFGDFGNNFPEDGIAVIIGGNNDVNLEVAGLVLFQFGRDGTTIWPQEINLGRGIWLFDGKNLFHDFPF
jgi:hypothetical protein